jgi:hypothetical protein
MLNINEKKIDVYNCKPLCPLQFDVGYITKFIKQGKIFYLGITAVTGCYYFDVHVACFRLFAYTGGERVSCQKEINISQRKLTLISTTTFRINLIEN